MFIIWNLTHHAYAAPPIGSCRVYTDKVELARRFKTVTAARAYMVDDERAIPLSEAIDNLA